MKSSPAESSCQARTVLLLPPSVTGRCSPLDHDVDSAAACNAPPPPSTGRCSPHDIVETSAPGCPGSSFPAYLGSHLSIVGCFWAWWRSPDLPWSPPRTTSLGLRPRSPNSGAAWDTLPHLACSWFFFWLVAAWVKSRAERPSVS